MCKMASAAYLFVLFPSMSAAFMPSIMHSNAANTKFAGNRCSVPVTSLNVYFRRSIGLNAGLGIGEEKTPEFGIKMPLDLVEQREEADRVLNKATEDGKMSLKEVESAQQMEAQALQEKLDQAIAKAMKGAEAELLEDYDKQTETILQNMRKERDIIREEAANIIRLKDELNSGGLWWNKPNPGAPKKSSLALTLATFLAWTFAFAAVNEIWQAQNTELGITPLVGGKAAFDVVIALISALIASKRSRTV